MSDPNQTVLKITVTRTEIIVSREDCHARYHLEGTELLRAIATNILWSLEYQAIFQVTDDTHE